MTLHVFNPEHDIALASNLSNFTAPYAGRQLRHDLGWLPVLWAGEDDMVLVEDAGYSERALQQFLQSSSVVLEGKARFVDSAFLKSGEFRRIANGITHVEPWGWDHAIGASLKRVGVRESLIPAYERIEQIRQLSHRRTSAKLLAYLTELEGSVGEASACCTVEEVVACYQRNGSAVIKTPWSSSGRGVRYVRTESAMATTASWLRNQIASQGSVMVEPIYNKVLDFAMEFEAKDDGEIAYLGLSVFYTHNGAYSGSLIAGEEEKTEAVSRYIPESLLVSVREKISALIPQILQGEYVGPFGVDMMVVSALPQENDASEAAGYLLHPCVELNLRRTMGHVALSLSQRMNAARGMMNVDYDGRNYKLTINKLL